MQGDGLQERAKALEGIWALEESRRALKALRISLGFESSDSAPVTPTAARAPEEKVDMRAMLGAFLLRGQ
jgi:hypothetical protein